MYIDFHSSQCIGLGWNKTNP